MKEVKREDHEQIIDQSTCLDVRRKPAPPAASTHDSMVRRHERPTEVGWYERHFTDSLIIGDSTMHWWDGQVWRNKPDGIVHWRQVGDYPAWRGLSLPAPIPNDNNFPVSKKADHDRH